MSTELRGGLAWLLLPVTALVMVFILAPLVVTVAMSISDSPYVVFPPRGFTLGWYAKILQDPDFQASLWRIEGPSRGSVTRNPVTRNKVCTTYRWREMDSNPRFLARRCRFLLRKANCGDRCNWQL